MSQSDTSMLGRKVDRIRCEPTAKDGEHIADTHHAWRSNTPSSRRKLGPMTTRCATTVAVFTVGPSSHSVGAQRAAPLPIRTDIAGFRKFATLDEAGTRDAADTAWLQVRQANLRELEYGG